MIVFVLKSRKVATLSLLKNILSPFITGRVERRMALVSLPNPLNAARQSALFIRQNVTSWVLLQCLGGGTHNNMPVVIELPIVRGRFHTVGCFPLSHFLFPTLFHTSVCVPIFPLDNNILTDRLLTVCVLGS